MASYNYTFTSGDTVTPTKLNSARTVSEIVNADVSATAAIAGTKVAPAFGAQDITVSGSNRSITNTGSFALSFGTNNSERVRITDVGNVGIGTTSPVVYNNNTTITAVGTNGAGLSIGSNVTTNRSELYFQATETYLKTINSSVLWFGTNNTERMRIDASGNVGIGTTVPSERFHVEGSSSGGNIRVLVVNTATNGYSALSLLNDKAGIWRNGSAQSGYAGNSSLNLGCIEADPIGFVTNNLERMRITGGGEVYIATGDQGAYNLQVGGTGVWAAGAYVNGSDERLKDNIAEITEGLEVVKKLRPVSFNYKPTYSKDTSKQAGFIAQELLIALDGKDYAEGTVKQGPEFYNVAYQNLIPVMAKAIQELSAKVEALEAA